MGAESSRGCDEKGIVVSESPGTHECAVLCRRASTTAMLARARLLSGHHGRKPGETIALLHLLDMNALMHEDRMDVE